MTFRFIATGDNHFHHGPRFAECVRIHAWIADAVARIKPDAVLLGGDLYEAPSVPDERTAAAEFHDAVADVCPIVEVQGNHGAHRDLRILRRRHRKHPIIVEEAAGVHYVGGAAIAAMAWPARASIAAMAGVAMSADATNAVAQEQIRNVLRGLGAQLAAHQGPRVLLGHFMVDGSVTTAAQPLVGAEMNIGLADLGLAGAHFTAMGHIHLAQHWEHNGRVMAYAGGPMRHTYGEPEAKSILYVQIEDDGAVRWERIPTPARPMHLVDGAYRDGRLEAPLPAEHETRDADIRIRYRVSEAERAAGGLAARELRARLEAAGAADVVLEPLVELTATVRAPEVVAAATVEAQLQARWARRGMPEDKQARLATVFADIAART